MGRVAACGVAVITLAACYGGPMDDYYEDDDQDVCDAGQTLPLLSSAERSESFGLAGDLIGVSERVSGSCLSDARARVYHYVPGSTMLGRSGTVSITWSGVEVGVVVRRTCEDDGSELGCRAPSSAGEMDFAVSDNQPLALMVVDRGTGSSAFNLHLRFDADADAHTAACGDEVVDGDETCDDGNGVSGDGCSAACQLELCQGATPAEIGVNLGNTVVRQARFAPACEGFAGLGAEQVFSYTPPGYGTLQLDLSSEHALGAYVAYACTSDPVVSPVDPFFVGAPPACAAPGSEQALRLPVDGSPLWLVVDGASSEDAGPFELDLAFEPGCGDGALQAWAGETCDDGGTSDGDGCSSACTLEPEVVCAQATSLELGSQSGDTTGALDAVSGSGCSGPDAVYAFVAPGDGVLSLILEAEADAALKLMNSCDEAALLGGTCLDEQAGGVPEVASRFLSAGEELFVAVDGAGPFALHASFTATD